MPARTVHAPVRPICPQTRMGWACWHGVVEKNGKKYGATASHRI
ncbi:MAG: hypothetical protein Q7T62_07640 [Undibacterium sp.]|nr:hypothetical protein [Undibacterium sp.]